MDTQTLFIIIMLVVLIAFGIGIAVFLISRKISELKKPDDLDSQKLLLNIMENLRQEVNDGSLKNRKEFQERFDKINDLLNKGLTDSSKTLQQQFAQSAQIIKEVSGELSKFSETGKQVLDVSKQLRSLENILKNPKQRGILGEYSLENLLSQCFSPEQYKMQYRFSNGDIVDAVIYIKNKQMLPVDAKFSLEKYNLITETHDKEKREHLEKSFKLDIKNRIDETSKYIRQNENTTDYAFMFIPAEGIYYNLLIYKSGSVDINSQDLIQYAHSKKVIITSPTSFYAYLQTIMQGLKEQKMRENFQEIIKKIGILSNHLNSYETYMQKLGNNLGTTVNMYNSAYKEFGKIDKDVYKITDGRSGGKTEPLLIDKPLDKTQ